MEDRADCVEIALEVSDVLRRSGDSYSEVNVTSQHDIDGDKIPLSASSSEEVIVRQYVHSMTINSDVVGVHPQHLGLVTYAGEVDETVQQQQYVLIADHEASCPTDHVHIGIVDTGELRHVPEAENETVADQKDDYQIVNQNDGMSDGWDDTTVSVMLMLIKSHHAQSASKKVDLWESVNVGLVEAGHNFSVRQCQQKWRNLVRAHRNRVRNARKETPDVASGEWPPGQDFVKEIADILALGKTVLNNERDDVQEDEPSVDNVPTRSIGQRLRGRPRRRPSTAHRVSAVEPEPKRSRRGRPALRRAENPHSAKRVHLRNGYGGEEEEEEEDAVSMETSRSPSPIQVRVITTGNGETSLDTHLQLLRAIKEMTEANARNVELLVETNKMLMKALRTQLRTQHREEMELRRRLLVALEQTGPTSSRLVTLSAAPLGES